ncbi:unnamed protein product, partial [marine sediment metagenome]
PKSTHWIAVDFDSSPSGVKICANKHIGNQIQSSTPPLFCYTNVLTPFQLQFLNQDLPVLFTARKAGYEDFSFYVGSEYATYFISADIVLDLEDPCKEVVCADYCDGYTLNKNGFCSIGVCYYDNIINSKACGYKDPVPQPPDPKPFWTNILDTLLSWLTKIFDFFFAVTGATEVDPGSTQTYQIDISTNKPDSDFSDGSYQRQVASWSLVDKNENIKQEGFWEEVNGDYSKSITITVPATPGDFAIVG